MNKYMFFKIAKCENGWLLEVSRHISDIPRCYIFFNVDDLAEWMRNNIEKTVLKEGKNE